MKSKRDASRNQNLKFILLVVIIGLLFVLFGKSIGVLFVIANILGVIMIMFLSNLYKKTGRLWFRWASWIGKIAYCLFLLSFILIEGFIIYELQESKKVDPHNIDFVIILGAGLHGEKPSKTLETRLEAGAHFLMVNRDIPVVVSGGQGPGESISEAAAMGMYLKNAGIEENRIFYENKSTTTYENLKYSKQLIEQLGLKEPTVLIITNDYHIVRAKMIAKEVGFRNYGLGADSPFFVKINYFIREYFGIVKTWFFQSI
jgi:uncharacterized SAM-binding protein YcdF (DUF218 family)